MAENIKHVARARRWRRAAIIGASISTVALIVFVIISFLPKGNDAFSIRIDQPYEKNREINHFHMSKSVQAKDEELPPVVRDNSLDSMAPTTAENVEGYLAEQELSENNYWRVEKSTGTVGLALVYTVYLVNESDSLEQDLLYSVNLDSFNNKSLIDYFRILVQTEEYDSSNNKVTDSLKNTYYGEKHNNTSVPYPNDLKEESKQHREPISTYRQEWGQDVIVSTYSTTNQDEASSRYCEEFTEITESNKAIVNAVEFSIPAGRIMRFTFVAYFEGEDMDCNGLIPAESYMLLSLHFGLGL